MRTKLLVALAAVMALLATSASAGHNLQFSFTLDDKSAGANSDATASVDYGTDHPSSGTTHLASGFEVAHADDNNSPLSPPPTDGEEVLDADVTGKWKALFCGSSTVDLDGNWVDPMDSGAPSGAVAQIEVTGLATTIDVWVIEQPNGDSTVAGAHYDLFVEDFGDDACDGSDVSSIITTFGTTANGNVVSKNPCSKGTYTVYTEYEDQNGGSHSDSDTVKITGNC